MGSAQCFVAERLPAMGRREPHLLAKEGSGENAPPGKQPPAPYEPPKHSGTAENKMGGGWG